jgi:putative hydrolase
LLRPKPDRSTGIVPLNNEQLAHRLDEVAALLEIQQANPFRVRAYREAANRVRELKQPVHQILENAGAAGIDRLPGIGQALTRAIEQLTFTDRLGLLERLRGEAEPERLLCTVTGIGPELASRIHQELGIDTLEDLEMAAHDGRLARIPGVGAKRIAGIQDSLETRLRRRAPRVGPNLIAAGIEHPDVAELLDVDREYREGAETNRLPRIAPRRFNPAGKAWLPVLHTQRGDRHYTALYSNTARAHQLGRERDWVVIYRGDHGGDGQWTVVTAPPGPLRGYRVVRGRESECSAYYDRQPVEPLPLWRGSEQGGDH